MNGFHDILFPVRVGRGAIGGPVRNIQIHTRANGTEARNILLRNSRRRWNIATRIAPLDELHEIIAFFEARMGRGYGFRFLDPIDNKSCQPSRNISAIDQEIAIADGIKKRFQLVKAYGDEQNKYIRKIKLPIIDSVSVAINGIGISQDQYEIDYQNGVIEFHEPPENDATLSAGFGFHALARFDIDAIELSLESANTGRINDIELIEVL